MDIAIVRAVNSRAIRAPTRTTRPSGRFWPKCGEHPCLSETAKITGSVTMTAEITPSTKDLHLVPHSATKYRRAYDRNLLAACPWRIPN
jgi:hypothetical protein